MAYSSDKDTPLHSSDSENMRNFKGKGPFVLNQQQPSLFTLHTGRYTHTSRKNGQWKPKG